MKFRRILSLMCILLIIFSMPIKVKAEDEKDQHIILIDAGHGGIDGGAKSKNGTIEKDINLAIASKLKKKLEDGGYKVYMTREDDSQLAKKKVEDLTKRCQLKKKLNVKYLFQYIRICFHRQTVLVHRCGMHQMIRAKNWQKEFRNH